jgi:FemAB-related protein (PEP-CTERM system-associated)
MEGPKTGVMATITAIGDINQITMTMRVETEDLQAVPAGSIDVSELQTGEEEKWDQFVTASPSGTFFHLAGWKTVIEKVLGRQCFYLAAHRGHQISGVLPISRVRSRLFGDCLVSLPLAVYGGICADDQASYFSLLKAGSDLANRLGVKYLELRNRTELFPTSLPGKDLYVTFTQDLSPGPEKLLKGLPRDTRYAVRKAQKAGLEWSEDVSIPEFYEIYAQSVHRLGTPVFPRELFTCLRNEFPKQVRLFAVRKGKTAIAGVLCFYFQDQVLPYYAGALPEYYKDAPNNFMYWSLMEQSCKEGLRQFDFGRSKRGTGSFDFKSAWSMTATELPYQYHLARAKEVPRLSPVDKKFQLPVAAWKRLPFSWTKVIGPRLIRWVPSI